MPDIPNQNPVPVIQPQNPQQPQQPPKPQFPASTLAPSKLGTSGSVVVTENPDGTKSYTSIITGEVFSPGSYLQLLDTLYHAKKGDTITIKIASPGGMVETGAAFLTAFENTQARVKTIGIGLVASIAAVIWLAGHDREMLPGSTLMVHGPSGFQIGKVSSIKEECDQIEKYFSYMITKLSDGILTDDQLHAVLTGRQDIFIPGEELNPKVAAYKHTIASIQRGE